MIGHRVTSGAALLLLAGGAAAADKAPVSPGMKALLACRAVTDTAERLGCFDREAAALGGEVEKGQVVVVDEAAARAAQRARFGLPAPGLDLFAGKDGAPLQTVLATATRNGDNLVALATHGRVGLEAILSASVGAQVVARSTGPLLLVGARQQGRTAGN